MPANLENSAVANMLEKVSFHSSLKERQCQRMFKLLHNCTPALISHTSKVMLKILQDGLQQYVNWEIPDVQAGFRKGRETRDQIANICWIIIKQENSRKISTFALLTMLKALTVWITTNCGKFFKRWEIPDHLTCLLRSLLQVKKQQLEPDIEQWTDSKLGKEYVKAVYCHPAYLTSMQSTSWEMLGWKKHKLESRLLGEISVTSDMQVTPTLWQKVKRN